MKCGQCRHFAEAFEERIPRQSVNPKSELIFDVQLTASTCHRFPQWIRKDADTEACGECKEVKR